MRAWLLFLLLLVAFPVRADDREPVILLVTQQNGPFVRRLRAELESMGFRVVVQRRDSDVPDGTVAVGRLAAGPPPELDIETVGGTQPRQSVVFDGADVATEIGSVRMAERVRAAFQPLAPRSVESAAQPPPPSSPPPQPALTRPQPVPRVAPRVEPRIEPPRIAPRIAPVPERRMPMGLSLGPVLPVDMGSVGMHAVASYWVSPLARLRLEPFVMAPLVPTLRDGPEGEARLYAGMIGALVNGVALETEPFELVLGGGASGVWLRVEGDPAAGYSSRTDDAFAASILADVAARIRVYEGFFITPRAFLGVSLPPVNVELSGRSVDRWGLPWFALALAAEYDWSL